MDPVLGLSHPGIRIVDAPARSLALVAWTVANELRLAGGRAVIISLDLSTDTIATVVNDVHQRTWPLNKKAGTTFGPYPVSRVLSEQAVCP
jgi:hypothetical protein